MNSDKHFKPAEHPHETGMLRVGRLHKIFYAVYGNPEGVPVVVNHGGPGSGHSLYSARHFDADKFRIVLYDQRGAGQSQPYADIRHNTPDLLVGDMEKLRTHLNIDKWHVWGHSWGSTLSLLYGEAHPDKTQSLTVSGIFLMRRKDVDWFVNKMGTVYPEAQEKFVRFLPKKERGDVLTSYFNRLADPAPTVHLPAAKVWSEFETACAFLDANPCEPDLCAEKELAISRLEAHYMKNNVFKRDNRIIADAHKIRNVPTAILQGRFDTICPAEGAYALKRALPEAYLKFFVDGHCRSTESGYDGEMRACADRILRYGSPVPRG